jgi:hypothetical protein
MVRKHDESVDIERVSPPRLAHGVPKRVDIVGEKTGATVKEIDGEEPAATGDKGATVVRHVATVAKSGAPFTPLLHKPAGVADYAFG